MGWCLVFFCDPVCFGKWSADCSLYFFLHKGNRFSLNTKRYSQRKEAEEVEELLLRFVFIPAMISSLRDSVAQTGVASIVNTTIVDSATIVTNPNSDISVFKLQSVTDLTNELRRALDIEERDNLSDVLTQLVNAQQQQLATLKQQLSLNEQQQQQQHRVHNQAISETNVSLTKTDIALQSTRQEAQRLTDFVATLLQTQMRYIELLTDARRLVHAQSTTSRSSTSDFSRRAQILLNDIHNIQQLTGALQISHAHMDKERNELHQLKMKSEELEKYLQRTDRQMTETSLQAELIRVSSRIQHIYDQGTILYLATVRDHPPSTLQTQHNSTQNIVVGSDGWDVTEFYQRRQVEFDELSAIEEVGKDSITQWLFPSPERAAENIQHVRSYFEGSNLQRSCGAAHAPSDKRWVMDTMNSVQFMSNKVTAPNGHKPPIRPSVYSYNMVLNDECKPELLVQLLTELLQNQLESSLTRDVIVVVPCGGEVDQREMDAWIGVTSSTRQRKEDVLVSSSLPESILVPASGKWTSTIFHGQSEPTIASTIWTRTRTNDDAGSMQQRWIFIRVGVQSQVDREISRQFLNDLLHIASFKKDTDDESQKLPLQFIPTVTKTAKVLLESYRNINAVRPVIVLLPVFTAYNRVTATESRVKADWVRDIQRTIAQGQNEIQSQKHIIVQSADDASTVSMAELADLHAQVEDVRKRADNAEVQLSTLHSIQQRTLSSSSIVAENETRQVQTLLHEVANLEQQRADANNRAYTLTQTKKDMEEKLRGMEIVTKRQMEQVQLHTATAPDLEQLHKHQDEIEALHRQKDVEVDEVEQSLKVIISKVHELDQRILQLQTSLTEQTQKAATAKSTVKKHTSAASKTQQTLEQFDINKKQVDQLERQLHQLDAQRQVSQSGLETVMQRKEEEQLHLDDIRTQLERILQQYEHVQISLQEADTNLANANKHFQERQAQQEAELERALSQQKVAETQANKPNASDRDRAELFAIQQSVQVLLQKANEVREYLSTAMMHAAKVATDSSAIVAQCNRLGADVEQSRQRVLLAEAAEQDYLDKLNDTDASIQNTLHEQQSLHETRLQTAMIQISQVQLQLEQEPMHNEIHNNKAQSKSELEHQQTSQQSESDTFVNENMKFPPVIPMTSSKIKGSFSLNAMIKEVAQTSAQITQ